MKTHIALLVAVTATLGCDTTEVQPSATTAESTSTTADVPVGAPKISAAAKVFEFGKVKLGTTVEHSFKLRNEGTAPLIIERAKGS